MGQFHAYASLFLSASSDSERSQVFAEAMEWLESKAGTAIENGLKTRIFAILCTRQGADFLRWAIGHDSENRNS